MIEERKQNGAIKTESVIKGLKCSVGVFYPTFEDCLKCPYYDPDDKWDNCSEFYIKWDALVLLEKLNKLLIQESPSTPRIMTRTEMFNSEIFFLESIAFEDIFPAFVSGISSDGLIRIIRKNSTDAYSRLVFEVPELYRKQWRAWTSRPTDEQRKATPWQ